MEKKETVKLWCLLGDATDDTSCYEKAWKLSHEKSSIAQRHWGLYYFNRKKVSINWKIHTIFIYKIIKKLITMCMKYIIIVYIPVCRKYSTPRKIIEHK